MIDSADDQSRQAWARLAGFLYLFTNATAIFAFSIRGRFTVRRDPMQTAANIDSGEPLFRLALAAELVTIAGVIPLFVGLYVVLRPVNRNLALLAAFWRIAENCILAVITFGSFTALALLDSTAAMASAERQQAATLVATLLRVHGSGFQVGFLFLGLGSVLFSYLWWRSRLIPRWLAGLGMFASALMAVVAVVLIVWPGFLSVITLAYMAPMGAYEIGLGAWLLFRGIRTAEP